MKSFRDRNPYVVGIVSLILLGAATGLAFAVGLLNVLEDAYEMRGEFTDASGLKSGDDVRLAGVKVGRVTGIEVDDTSGRVVVTWVVNTGIDIKDEANADIALATLLGAKYVRIGQPTVGDTNFEDLPVEQRLIPVERTSVPFDIFELTRLSTEGINELDTEAVNQFINDLADLTEDKSATVADLVDGITRVATAINSRDAELAELLDEADRLAATLADKDDEIIELLDASDRILDLVVARRDQLALVLGESAESVQLLSSIISDNRAQLDSILDSLSPTLDVVSKNQADIDAALARLGPAFLQQAQGGTHGPWQDIFVRGLGPASIDILSDVYRDILGAGEGP